MRGKMAGNFDREIGPEVYIPVTLCDSMMYSLARVAELSSGWTADHSSPRKARGSGTPARAAVPTYLSLGYAVHC
jgi:hypothetical protein